MRQLYSTFAFAMLCSTLAAGAAAAGHVRGKATYVGLFKRR